MLYIKLLKDDVDFFQSLSQKYNDITIMESKNFNGDLEFIEVVILLSPYIFDVSIKLFSEILRNSA